MIFKRVCPYCKEKVKKDALICRYCHRELEPQPESDSLGVMGLVAGLLGITVGAALALAFGVYRERQRWKQNQVESQDDRFGQ